MRGKVSVIIPKRRGENIDTLIGFVKKSSYTNIEIIVVDEGLERSKQRNIGIDRAKGEYLLILDSDQYPNSRLIEECVGLMKDYDALYIPEIIITDGWFARVRNWERQFYNGTAVDCVRFVKSGIAPYFDERMSGPEDSDWDRRIRGKKGITKNHVYHNDGVKFLDFFKKKAYYAKSMDIFNAKWPGDKVTNPKWRCWDVYMENGKWRRCLSSPHMFIAVLFLIFIRGVIYLFASKPPK